MDGRCVGLRVPFDTESTLARSGRQERGMAQENRVSEYISGWPRAPFSACNSTKYPKPMTVKCQCIKETCVFEGGNMR